jgi:hypothetical protein
LTLVGEGEANLAKSPFQVTEEESNLFWYLMTPGINHSGCLVIQDQQGNARIRLFLLEILTPSRPSSASDQAVWPSRAYWRQTANALAGRQLVSQTCV